MTMDYIGDDFTYPESVYKQYGDDFHQTIDITKAPQKDGIPWMVHGGVIKAFTFGFDPKFSNNEQAFIDSKSDPVEGKYVFALKEIPDDQWMVVNTSIHDKVYSWDSGVILAAKGDLSSYYRVGLGTPGQVFPTPTVKVYRVVNGVAKALTAAVDDRRPPPYYLSTVGIYSASGFTPPQFFGKSESKWTYPNAIVVNWGGQPRVFIDPNPLTGRYCGFFMTHTEGFVTKPQAVCYGWRIDNGDAEQYNCSITIDASLRSDHNPKGRAIHEFVATPTGAGGVPEYTGVRVDEDYNNFPAGFPPDHDPPGTRREGDDIPGGEFDEGPDPAQLPGVGWG